MAYSARGLYLIGVVLLGYIPGVLCYDYDIGGMVAAAVLGAFCFAAIVLMVVFIFFWRNWYMKRMAREGRYRFPREKWRLFFGSKKKKTSHSLLSTPKSERRMNIPMYEMKHASGLPGSRPTTISRAEPRTDTWVTELPRMNRYEEKSKTLKLEPEEDAVIVAEVLPDQTQTTHFRSNNLRTTNGPAYVVTTSAPTDVTYQEVSYQPASQNSTMFVPYNAGNKSPAQLRTTKRETVSYEPYHVQVSQLSQSTRPANAMTSGPVSGKSRKENMYISPNIPAASSAGNAANEEAIVMFDSDDEAGNIPNIRKEEDVLF